MVTFDESRRSFQHSPGFLFPAAPQDVCNNAREPCPQTEPIMQTPPRSSTEGCPNVPRRENKIFLEPADSGATGGSPKGPRVSESPPGDGHRRGMSGSKGLEVRTCTNSLCRSVQRNSRELRGRVINADAARKLGCAQAMSN